MPTRGRKQPRGAVVLDDDDHDNTPGSGQSRASYAADLTAQPALLAAASAAHSRASTTSTDPTRSAALAAAAAEATPKKKKKRSLADLEGFHELKSGGTQGAGDGAGKKREKPIEAVIKLATHQQGEKKGTLSGRAYYAINPAFDDNNRLKEVVQIVMKQRPRFFEAWNKWAVLVPSAEIAMKLHATIRADTQLKATSRKLNASLDVTPFDNPAVKKYSFVLAESEISFETRAEGVLPRSILIIGETYPFKEFLKEKFEGIRYLDLIFNDGTVTKSGWVLPVSAQTAATGTLADFLHELGAKVTEENLDEGEDDSEEDDERDDDALVEAEAEEAADDDEEGEGEGGGE